MAGIYAGKAVSNVFANRALGLPSGIRSQLVLAATRMAIRAKRQFPKTLDLLFPPVTLILPERAVIIRGLSLAVLALINRQHRGDATMDRIKWWVNLLFGRVRKGQRRKKRKLRSSDSIRSSYYHRLNGAEMLEPRMMLSGTTISLGRYASS